MKVKKRKRQDYHVPTKINIQYNYLQNTQQMSNVGICKSAKHDSLFMIYIASHETNIYIAKIMRNNIVDIKIMLNN